MDYNNINQSSCGCNRPNGNRPMQDRMNRCNCGNVRGDMVNRNGMRNRGNMNNVMNRKNMGVMGDTAMRRKPDGCDRGNEPVDRMAPGMAFVPWQEWDDIYDMEKALERGTIFEELDKPFLGRPLK